ncbi:MAG: hypothetical protein ACE5NL_02210, partial [Candidatus Hydrothermarchaeaceae archaeon]
MSEEHGGYESTELMTSKNLWLAVGFGLFIIIGFLIPTPQSLVEVVSEKGYYSVMHEKGIAETPQQAAWKAKLVIAITAGVIIFFAT